MESEKKFESMIETGVSNDNTTVRTSLPPGFVINKNMEMLDVLDENGVITGEIRSRGDCHKQGLWHRIALACIVNDNNQILMQQRSPNVSKFPGMWDLSVASHVQSGEDSLQTILRETNEEIGYQIGRKIQVSDFKSVTSFRNQHTVGDIIENQYYDLFILFANIDTSQLTFNDDEVSQIRYVNYTELLKMDRDDALHPRKEWIPYIIRIITKL